MRRRMVGLSALLVALVAAGCRDVAPPLAPQSAKIPGVRPARVVEWTVESLIAALFDGPNEQSALSQWKNIEKDLAETPVNQSSLLSHVNNLTKFTLSRLLAGELVDPDGSGILNPTSGALKLLSLVFGITGVTATEVPEVPSGVDAAFYLVDPNAADDQLVVTSLGDAATVVEDGTFDEPVILAIVRLPEEPFVNTPYPKLSRTFDVGIAPEVDFEALSVLVCPLEGVTSEVNDRAVIAHQRTETEVEYLDRSTVGNLTCPHDISDAWRERDGFLNQRLGQFASYAKEAWKALAPKPLYAGHAAIGGFIDEDFSPMVAVDPFVATGVVISPISESTYGQTVEVSATLARTGGPAELIGAVIPGMQLMASVDGGAAVAVTTDADGVGHWQFARQSAGTHTVAISFAGATTPENAPLFGASAESASFVVNPAPLTLSANDASRPYGQENPPFSGSMSGAQYDDVLTLGFQTDATVTSLPGAYDIVPTVSGAAISNYVVAQVNKGTLTIERIPLTISVVGGNYVYGQNACVVQYSISLDGLPAPSGTLQCLVGGQPLAIPSPVGSYTVTPGGLTSPIYDITYQSAVVTVLYNTAVGHYFISPIPNTQYQQGRNIPAKFQLFMADGVTPVTNAVATASVINVSTGASVNFGANVFVYSASSKTYTLGINLPRDIPLGFYTVRANLNDGSTITSLVEIKSK